MGVPAWCAVNKLADADTIRGTLLSGGEPTATGFDYLDDAFPATQLYDFRPGTVARFASAGARAILAYFPVAPSFDTIWVCNHNVPANATLKLMTSPSGVAASWTTQWTATVAELGETDLAKLLAAPVGDKYVALVLQAVGSLVDPWEVGEFGIGTRTEAPVGFEFGLMPRGRRGAKVTNRSQYGVLETKSLGRASRVYEGSIGLGQDDAGMDVLEGLYTDTNHGASPFLWVQDTASSVAVCARADGLDEFGPALDAPDVYGSLSLRIEEVPRGRGTV